MQADKSYFKFGILLLLSFMWLNESYALTNTAQTGSWSNSSTWVNNAPQNGDTIYINAGHTVTVRSQQDYTSNTSPMFLIIEGVLNFNNGKKILLPCGSGVLIKAGGSVTISGGGGSSNRIDICGTPVWNNLDGAITELNYLHKNPNVQMGFHPTLRNYAIQDGEFWYFDTFPPMAHLSQDELEWYILQNTSIQGCSTCVYVKDFPQPVLEIRCSDNLFFFVD